MNQPTPQSEAQPVERRGVLAAISSIIIGTGLILTPLFAGLWSFLDPVIRRKDGSGTPVEIGTLAEVPSDGSVVQFEVVGEKFDAWTKTVGALGSVYVRRKEPGSDELIVLHATCPHAGCFVNYSGSQFKCPCHNSVFHLDGARGEPCVSPRPMDALEYTVSKDGAIQINFQNFLAGKTEKIPV